MPNHRSTASRRRSRHAERTAATAVAAGLVVFTGAAGAAVLTTTSSPAAASAAAHGTLPLTGGAVTGLPVTPIAFTAHPSAPVTSTSPWSTNSIKVDPKPTHPPHWVTPADRARAAARQAAAARAAQQVAAFVAIRQAAAQQAAAQQAAAQQTAAAATASRSETRAPLTSSYSGDPRAIAQQMLAARGEADQFSCLDSLWNRESGWSISAANASGAYGIPQALPGSKMASAGGDWQSNPATQISWGLGYIDSTYGSPCAAWGHSQANGWY